MAPRLGFMTWHGVPTARCLQVARDFSRNKYFDTAEAQEYGLIDQASGCCCCCCCKLHVSCLRGVPVWCLHSTMSEPCSILPVLVRM